MGPKLSESGEKKKPQPIAPGDDSMHRLLTNRIFICISILSSLFSTLILIFHFHIIWLPLSCLLLGFLIRMACQSNYLEIFSFLIPILPVLAVLENKGFPRNYLLLPLFVLCGIIVGEVIAGSGKAILASAWSPKGYFFYLLLLGVSFIFVLLRWSNLTLSPLAVFKDTPVAPSGQRLSFGIIFPLVEMALFALSPLYFFLLSRRDDLRRILVAFLCGQSLSILYSLVQRWQGKNSVNAVLNGFATDPTAFGFLSALALLLAWYLFHHYGHRWLGLFFTGISFIGILNSMTRVGLFAIVAALLFFIFFSRRKIITLLIVGILITVSLISYIHFFQHPGANFLSRLENDLYLLKESPQLRKFVNLPLANESDPRNLLWQYSLACLRQYPVTGVGAGNFVFWVMATQKRGFFHHLPANQYFFIANSTGLIGLTAFLSFCFWLFPHRNWPEKWLLGTFLFLIIFNDYLWFAEIFLTFWLFISLGRRNDERPVVSSKCRKVLCFCVFLLFTIFNLLEFSNLHPKNGTRVNSIAYDYGFSYPEKNGVRTFRWSGAEAGIYVFMDKANPRVIYKLTSSAPFFRIPGKAQAVNIYWRGKLYRRVVFREQREYLLQLYDSRHSEGFLEFRVHPIFNLKKMGLGAESRDLGVQINGPGL